jgi:streptogramin lyase
MANTFTSYVAKDVGTSASSVMTVPSATITTVIGLSIANTSASAISVNVYVTRSGTDYYIVKGAPVPIGATFVASGGDEKLVMVAADVLKVSSSAATSADVIVSVLELS